LSRVLQKRTEDGEILLSLSSIYKNEVKTMGKNNLIPINSLSKDEAFAIRSKGGKAKSKRKTLANRIKNYNRCKPENKERYFSEKIEPFLNEPNLFKGIMLEHAMLMKKKAEEAGDFQTMAKLQSALTDTFRTAYGNKTYNVNMDIDIEKEAEEMLERMKIMDKKMKEYNKENEV
jgi:hypothetical protein